MSGVESDRRDAQKMRDVPIRVHCPHCGFCPDGAIGDGELRREEAA